MNRLSLSIKRLAKLAGSSIARRRTERKLSGPENDAMRTTLIAINLAIKAPRIMDHSNHREHQCHAELVTTFSRRVSAHDPMTGKLLWTCGGTGPLLTASPMSRMVSLFALVDTTEHRSPSVLEDKVTLLKHIDCGINPITAVG